MARKAAKDISCANNQRQIGIAYHAYTGDFNDYLPTIFVSGQSVNDIMIQNGVKHSLYLIYDQGYIKVSSGETFYCPQRKNEGLRGDYTHPVSGWNGSDRDNIRWAGYLTRGSAWPERTMKELSTGGGEKVLFTDFGFWYYGTTGMNHLDGYNVLYADGHVKWFPDPHWKYMSYDNNGVAFITAAEAY